MSREAILGRIRAQLKRGPLEPAQAAACDRRLAAAPAALLPRMAQFADRQALTAAFCQRLTAGGAELRRVTAWPAVPATVAAMLGPAGRPALGLAPALAMLDWAAAGLTVVPGPARPAQPAAITKAVAGIAETGSVVLASGPETPVTLNFLPDIHVVCLEAAALVASLEDGFGAARAGGLPRSITLIGGPSRTADIEQRMVMGAHGPRRLVVLLVGDHGG